MSDIGMILQRLGNTLVTGVAPKLEGDYAAGHAMMTGVMAVMAGEAWDNAFVTDVTNHLFESGKNSGGLDLVALNIQRGRDHGLAGEEAFMLHL